MFYAQKKLGWTIDWEKVKFLLAKSWDVIKYRYYTGLKANDAKMGGFLKYLDKIGFTVATKPLKVIKIDGDHPLYKLHNYTEIYKSNFDVEIAADIIFDRPNIDQIILFSGDSDFDYLAKKMKAVGKKVTIFASRKTLSWELKLAASEYRFLENHRLEIERK